VIEFRKHFGWYTKGLHCSSELRARLFRVESMAEAEALFGAYLAPRASVAEVA
jgi:tRNA-dihydrouridine synthase